jgi:hypothetical protein
MIITICQLLSIIFCENPRATVLRHVLDGRAEDADVRWMERAGLAREVAVSLRDGPFTWWHQQREERRLRADVVWVTPQLAQGARFDSRYAPLVAALGIGSVLDLREDEGHDGAMLAAAGVRYLNLPMPEFEPPVLRHLQEGVRWSLAEMASGRAVLVHCRLGVSRSPLMASAVLVGQGHSVASALAAVRKARPRRQLNDEQLACLVDFEAMQRAPDAPRRGG